MRGDDERAACGAAVSGAPARRARSRRPALRSARRAARAAHRAAAAAPAPAGAPGRRTGPGRPRPAGVSSPSAARATSASRPAACERRHSAASLGGGIGQAQVVAQAVLEQFGALRQQRAVAAAAPRRWRRELAREQRQQGRLAGAAGADQRDALAGAQTVSEMSLQRRRLRAGMPGVTSREFDGDIVSALAA